LSKPLSDDEVLALLKMALAALGEAAGETTRANTALITARTALAMLALSLAGAVSLSEDDLRGVIEPVIEPSIRH
jgi:hypothetical protein